MASAPSVEPEVIRDLATAGLPAARMATMLGVRVETIKGIARRYSIELPLLSAQERSAIVTEAQRRRRAAEKRAAQAPHAQSDQPIADDDQRGAPEVDAGTQALIATGGRYAALADYAAAQGITTAQALSRWHRLGLRLGAKGVR